MISKEIDRTNTMIVRWRCGLLSQGLAAVGILLVSVSLAADGKLNSLEEQAFKQAAALVDPSIVRIETVGGLEQLENVLLGTGPTTGVVVSSDGYIISSSFNFASKPASILVTLPDGRRMAAKQIASDRLRLLTLLKIDAEGLIPAKPAPRDDIKVGQWAVALGRTLDNSTPNISVGIVSAVNRVWGKAIQTDAKTSPVNYGGALIDVEGRVLGVIAPLSPSGNGETAGHEWYDGGIGFAIPLEDIYASLDHLKQGTDLLPGLMGITFVGGQSLNVPAVVDRVRYNSPAQQSGLKPNDRIVEADGTKIGRVAQLKHVLGRKYAGESVKIVVARGEESIPLEISLVGQLIPYESPFLGILPQRKIANAEMGLGIRFVFAKSPAEMAGLARGDQIRKFNGVEIKDTRALGDLVGRCRPGDRVSIVYVREGHESTADVTLGAIPEEVVSELPTDLIERPANPDAEDKAVKDQPPAQETEKKPSELKTGRFNAKLESLDHDYWAYVPETYTDTHAYGLVVWIHPAGDTMEAAIFKQWKSICDRRGLILLAPKAETASTWEPGEAEFIKALIVHVREKYTLDGSRIVLHSFGSGAGMAWLVGMKQRELIRGIVVAGAPFFGPTPENEPDNRQQFFFLCGDADRILPRVKASVTGLRKLKLPVALRTIKGLAAKYPEEDAIEEIGRWVDSLDRI